LTKRGELINFIFLFFFGQDKFYFSMLVFMQKEMLYTCSMLQAAAVLMLQVSEGQKV
jgi:hypothetical protein